MKAVNYSSSILLFVTFLCAGCGAVVAPPRAFDVGPVKLRIDSLNRTYNDHFASPNEQLYVDRYTLNGCVMPTSRPRVCGRDSIAAFYTPSGNSHPIRVTMNAEEVSGGSDQVVEVGNYLISDTAGTRFDKGKYVSVWKPEDGRWKKDLEIWNSDMSARSNSVSTNSTVGEGKGN